MNIKIKKYSCLFLLIIITALMVLNVSANSGNPYVVDEAELLSDSEYEMLEEKAKSISEKWDFDLVIVTVNELTSASVQDMADDYYDYNGYGTGEQRSGAILLVCMDAREYHISTRGYGTYAFTDYGMEQMDSVYVQYLSYGEYYRAFDAYLSECDHYLEEAYNGTPVDVPSDDITREAPKAFSGARAVGSAITAFFAALISGTSKKSKLKSVHRQTGATSYEKRGSLNLSTEQDVFLFRKMAVTHIEPSQSARGGHGGSTTHISSSGASHGGHGGHF